MALPEIKIATFPQTTEQTELPTSKLLACLNAPCYQEFYAEAGLQAPTAVEKGWAISPKKSPFLYLYYEPGSSEAMLLVVRRNPTAEIKKFFPRSYPEDVQQRATLLSSLLEDEECIIPTIQIRNEQTGEVHLASLFEPAMITMRDWLKTICRYDEEDHRAPEFYPKSRDFLTSLFTPQAISDIHRLIATSMIFHLEDIQSRNVGLILNQEGKIERVAYFDHKLSFNHPDHEDHGCYYLSPQEELLTGIRFGWETPRPNPNLYSLAALVSYYTDIDIDPDVVASEYKTLCDRLRSDGGRVEAAISAVDEPLQANARHLIPRHLNGNYPLDDILQSHGGIFVNGERPPGKHIFACIKHAINQLRQLHFLTGQPLNTTGIRDFDIFTRSTLAYMDHFQRMGIEATPARVFQPQIIGHMLSALLELEMPLVDNLEPEDEIYIARTEVLTLKGERKKVLLVLPIAVDLAGQFESMMAQNQLLSEMIRRTVDLTSKDTSFLPAEIITKYQLDALSKIGCFNGVEIYELPGES